MGKRKLTREELEAYAEVSRALKRLRAVERRVAFRRGGGVARCALCGALCEPPVKRGPQGRPVCARCLVGAEEGCS